VNSNVELAARVDILSILPAGWELRKVGATEFAGPCPMCGGEDRFHVCTRRNKWLCRGCAEGVWSSTIDYIKASLGLATGEAIAFLVEGNDALPQRVIRREVITEAPPPAAPPRWLEQAPLYTASYRAHAQKYRAWQKYKPLTNETIDRFELGVGVLPPYSSSCQHERLIVPVRDMTGVTVGYRARRIDCACDRHWTATKGIGSHIYGWNTCSIGSVIWIVENNVDALLFWQEYREYGWGALSPTTGAATHWRKEWLYGLAAWEPQLVVVAYDHDEAGVKGGIKLTRELNAQGFTARRFEWPASAPTGADVGWYLTEGRAHE
jgi:hypothetical protein